MSEYQTRIVSSHSIMLGKPCIKGTRLAIELILRKLGEGATTQDLMTMYPILTKADLEAVWLYAADVLANEEMLVLV